MGYWGNVHQRAKREVLEMLRLEHPGRVALTLGVIVVPAAITWLASHDATGWLRALATAGALGICGALAYGVKMLSPPPVIAAEAENEQARLAKQLASFEGPDDDAGLRDGIAYALTGNWDGEMWARDGALGYVHEIGERIRKLSVRERLHVWGTAGGAVEVPRPIPPSFLQSTTFNFLSLTTGSQSSVKTDKNDGHVPPRWHNLRINRAEFEREFPSPWKPDPASSPAAH